MDEELLQTMTFVLEDIDAQLSKAHKEATLLLRSVRRHGQTTRQMHKHCMNFSELFAQLEKQGSSKHHSHEKSPSPEVQDHNESTDSGFEEDTLPEHDIDEQEVRLKTTKLADDVGKPPRKPPASLSESNLSLDITSPAMLRTPFLKPTTATPASQLSIQDANLATPDIPVLSGHVQVLSTPPSNANASPRPDVSVLNSSVSSFNVELHTTTPMRYHPSTPRQMLSPPHAESPEMPVLSRHSFLQQTPFESKEDEDSPNTRFSTSAIKPSEAPNTVPQTPMWVNTPSTNLRRRFSALSELQSPPIRKTPRKQPRVEEESEEISSPRLGSPLLSTKLRVMTPRTPLSNRLAGADTSFPASRTEDPLFALSPRQSIPSFDLSTFPVAFQRGTAACQLTTLYNHFCQDATRALTLSDLTDKMDDCEVERIEIFLETLVSRRLLRPSEMSSDHLIVSPSMASIASECSDTSVSTKAKQRPLFRLLAAAAQTGASNFILAYNVRAGIAVLVRIVTLLQKKQFKAILSLRLLLSEKHLNFRVEAVSMGLFIGWFTGGYQALKAIIKRLRDVDNEDIEDPLTTAIAGTLAGTAVVFVEPGKRRSLALYALARALQCLYNSAKSRDLWHFWGSKWAHGDSLLFGITSAQVMYTFILRPSILPKEYSTFIHRTGPVAWKVLNFVQRNNRGEPVEREEITRFLSDVNSPVTYDCPHNQPSIIPCDLIHHPTSSCSYGFFLTLFKAMRGTLPLYMSLNIVPQVVLQFRRFLRAPFYSLFRGILGGFRSTLFMGSFVALYQSAICAHRRLFRLVSSFSIFIEAKSRRSELALYVLPRAVDSLFIMLRDKRWLADVPYGEVMLFGISMGAIMFCFEVTLGFPISRDDLIANAVLVTQKHLH
ncbi:hypothetical protein THRCLA_01326 [Thraustotheca clavata]|uniref:Transmembrane protein 135 N-terminal domain-containing protein n=1 Tax=Thraustotheca clavata TaxID=74557 RepID=A0A1W0A8L4_9STRA|nr:hypothetical protein THRCLA_01326 [Thraustotheca clavata]